jgi:hypothetical protein
MKSTLTPPKEHHGGVPDGTPETAGTVTAVHCRHAPSPGADARMPGPVRSSAVLTPVTQADGWTPDRDGLRFAGYLVRVAA